LNGKRATRYGIMGGTFNPIHYGHLVTAEEARIQFGLDKVIFVPTGVATHKEADQAITPEERYIMTVIATASNPDFIVSRMEVEREEPTYTIETLKELNEIYKGSELCFITGADAVWEILTWKDPESLSKYCTFIAATRPGYSLKKFEEIHVLPYEDREDRKMPKVSIMEIPALAISSTDIRKRVRTGRTIRYLVPEGVLNYIYKSGFYELD